MKIKPIIGAILISIAVALFMTSCVFSPVEGDIFVPLTETKLEERTTESAEAEATTEITTVATKVEATTTSRTTSRTTEQTTSAGPMLPLRTRPSQVQTTSTNATETTKATTQATTQATTTKQTAKPPSNTLTPGSYVLRVFYDIQTVVAYRADASGTLVPIRSMACSTGLVNDSYLPNVKRSQPRIWAAARYQRFSLYGISWHQYATWIEGDYFFHSIGYGEKVENGVRKIDLNNFQYWEYDKLGSRASHGCIRLTVDDARFIYNNASSFSKIEFIASSAGYGVGKAYKPARAWNFYGDPTDYQNYPNITPTPTPSPTPAPTTTPPTTTPPTTTPPTTTPTTTTPPTTTPTTTTPPTTETPTTTAAPPTTEAPTTAAPTTAAPTTAAPTTAAPTTAAPEPPPSDSDGD